MARLIEDKPRSPIPTIVTQSEWTAIYLTEIEENGGRIGPAAEKAGVTNAAVCGLRERDQDFARAEVEAFKRSRAVAEDAARTRAIHGVVTERIQRPDGTVAEKITYSDTLLLRLLERGESGSWLKREQKLETAGIQFNTRAERKAAIERAEREVAKSKANLGERPLSHHSENGAGGEAVTEREAQNGRS